MATKGSNYYGTAIEHTYDEGANTVKSAVLKLCGETVPPFIVVPALAVTRDNLAQAWQEGFHRPRRPKSQRRSASRTPVHGDTGTRRADAPASARRRLR